MKKLTIFLLSALVGSTIVNAQNFSTTEEEILPKFSLTTAGNGVIIGWTNNFTNVQQISIQRSHDSLTGYKTLLTVTDPTAPQNGYMDSKPGGGRMFYRLYIMLDKGIFLFSNAKRPAPDTTQISNDLLSSINKVPDVDSASRSSSSYVYTQRDGYIRISLPSDEKPKKYSIKFFKEDGTFLFEIKEVKERSFKIDKTNFYQAGWFLFELYEDAKLINKDRFYLEKDF